jgi:hypothetical protein
MYIYIYTCEHARNNANVNAAVTAQCSHGPRLSDDRCKLCFIHIVMSDGSAREQIGCHGHKRHLLGGWDERNI